MYGLEYHFTGDWEKAKRLFGKLPKNLQDVVTSSQRSVAELFVRKVKNHLKNQDIPGWTPLSTRYAERKIGKWGTLDLLMASTYYYQSIKAWREDKMYLAGVPFGIYYPDGKEVARIAMIHEDWSFQPGKPHRPLWSYTIEKDMGGMPGFKRMINSTIKKKLEEKGYKVTIRF